MDAPEIMDRIASAFERIANILEMRYKLEHERFDREYPKHQRRDAIISRLPTDEDKLRASQGATGESLEEWTNLGPRERKILESARATASDGSKPKAT